MKLIMTEDRARILLLKIEQTKRDLSIVEAELIACISSVAITNTGKNKKDKKNLELENQIRMNFHK